VSLLVIIVILGWLLNHWMTKPLVTNVSSEKNEAIQVNDLDKLFSKAVTHMQKKEYAQAVNQWHQILLINSAIPEVNVNMGFSLFELGRFETARDFFISAMEQSSFQANAYYGLAISSEKLGDLEGALGAMKSYIHLAQNKQDEPYLRKARSAIWEWEALLTEQREQKDSSISVLKESEKNN